MRGGYALEVNGRVCAGNGGTCSRLYCAVDAAIGNGRCIYTHFKGENVRRMAHPTKRAYIARLFLGRASRRHGSHSISRVAILAH